MKSSFLKIAVIINCDDEFGKGILLKLLEEGFFVYGINKTPVFEKLKNYRDIVFNSSQNYDIREAFERIPVISVVLVNHKNHEDYLVLENLNENLEKGLEHVFVIKPDEYPDKETFRAKIRETVINLSSKEIKPEDLGEVVLSCLKLPNTVFVKNMCI